MTSPQDPFAAPDPSAPQQPPQQGYPPPAPRQEQPGYGQPPAYGQQPGYGQPPQGYTPQQWQDGTPYGSPTQAGTNGFAIAALVTAFFCAPLGIVFGLVARSQIKRTGQAGSGLALAGIILGVVGLVFSVLYFGALGAALSGSGSGSDF